MVNQSFDSPDVLQTLNPDELCGVEFPHCHPTQPVPLQIEWLERVPHMLELQL